MSSDVICSLAQQAIAAVCHLHMGPQVCHLDVKPENFIVHEQGGQIVVKLTDFDLALVQVAGVMCRTPCGTLPFMSPEVFLDRGYYGMQADIWSLGIVLFEVFCGLRVIESIFNFSAAPVPASGFEDMLKRIKNGFEAPGAVAFHLRDRCLSEPRRMLALGSRMLTGMLNVVGAQRWPAHQVLQHSRRLAE